jgi:hypothetical protein
MDGGNLIHSNVVAAATLNNSPDVLEYILNHRLLEKGALEVRTSEEFTECLLN